MVMMNSDDEFDDFDDHHDVEAYGEAPIYGFRAFDSQREALNISGEEVGIAHASQPLTITNHRPSAELAVENVEYNLARLESCLAREAELMKELESLVKQKKAESLTQEQLLEMQMSNPRGGGGEEEEEFVVTPWTVSAKAGVQINYNKLIDEFGCDRLDQFLIDRVDRITFRQPHIFLRRGMFFAQRDFDKILNAYEKGEKFYLYTGRGPSSESLHLGHLVPFMFAKYLQDAFKVPLVIQLTDDEKYLWKELSLKECKKLARENAKDIIACGFDVTKTFIFANIGYVRHLFDNVLRIQKAVTSSQAGAIFGLTGKDSIGKTAFPAYQAAPSFPNSFPHLFSGKDKEKLRCLIPCAIDQDPYFRMTRDVARSMGHHKPALIESSFFPALQGVNKKMSASDPNSAIFVTDSEKLIEEKINNYAFCVEYGGNLDFDIPFKYLTFFLEDDDELEHIRKEYSAGRMATDAVKKRVVEVLRVLMDRIRRARAAVTEEMVDAFMAVRPLPNMFN